MTKIAKYCDSPRFAQLPMINQSKECATSVPGPFVTLSLRLSGDNPHTSLLSIQEVIALKSGSSFKQRKYFGLRQLA